MAAGRPDRPVDTKLVSSASLHALLLLGV